MGLRLLECRESPNRCASVSMMRCCTRRASSEVTVKDAATAAVASRSRVTARVARASEAGAKARNRSVCLC